MGFDVIEGMKSAYSVDWLVAVAAGKIPGFSILDKFGRNPAAGTIRRPVWQQGNQDYTYLENAEGLRAYAGVNTATNAMVFEIINSGWGTTMVSATLTGTTPINLGTGFRCNRFYNDEPGRTLGILAGYVEVVGSGAVTAGTAAAAAMVKARIDIPYEQTEQAIFTVPVNQQLQIWGVWAGINESSGVSAVAIDLEMWVGKFNRPMLNKRTVGMTNLGGNPTLLPWGVPLVVDPKADVELKCLCDATGLDIGAGFYGLLIDV